ncbi:MAG: hypothetical protein ACPGF7_09485 [Pontibacterium sp.]
MNELKVADEWDDDDELEFETSQEFTWLTRAEVEGLRDHLTEMLKYEK